MPRHLVECLTSLVILTAYGNDYEIILVNTGDLAASDRKKLDGMGGGRIKIVDDERKPFNYSASNNLGVKNSKSSLLLFINNDIKIIEPDWLSEMALWAQREEIGAVGARLLYPDGTIQHNGAIIGLDGFAGHVFAGNRPGEWTLMGPTEWYRNFLAVTGACMMVRREVFLQSGGFNEDFELCGGDVDLCMRIRKLGLRNLVTPFSRLVHLESRTRKGKPVPKKDYEHSYPIYLPYLEHGDPAFNRNLSCWHSIPQLQKKGEESALGFAAKHLDALK
jgi:GT2 family glycosyltransferase